MFQQAMRFGAIGIANTLFGFAAVLAALAVGLGDYAANACGYAVGLTVGFILNRRWTFAGAERRAIQWPLYLLAFALSYLANLGVLSALRLYETVPVVLAHLAAMTAYTACFFALCRVMVFAEGRPRVDVRWLSPGVVLLATALVGAPFIARISLSHDVIWQLWIARQMMHGTELYVGIIEVNPPLWFWMGLAVQKLAVPLGAEPTSLLSLAIWFWAALSAWLVGLLCPELSPRRRMALTLFTFAVCTLMPLHNYAQREHLVLIAGLPYAFLIAARARGLKPEQWLVLTVAIGAGLAFALKHYFVLAPVLAEAWLFYRLRRDYRLFRVETVVLAALAVFYAGAVVVWAKPFLDDIVPMVALAYGGYNSPVINWFDEPEQLVWLAAAFSFIRLGRPNDPMLRGLAEILLIFAAVFALAYFVQQKGWQYHAIPATGMAIMAVFVAMILRTSPDWSVRQQPLPALVCAIPLIVGAMQGPYQNASQRAVAITLHRVPQESTFLSLATRPSRVWPMVDTEGYRWPSRYFAFWMLATIGKDEADGSPDPALQRLGREVVHNTVEDMRCNPPQLIFSEVEPTQRDLRKLGFRLLDFFGRDPEFVEVMQHYRLVASTHVYRLYQLERPYGAKPGDDCRVLG